MTENTRDLLNKLYLPLDKKANEFIAAMSKLHGGFKLKSGFFNGHYHKNEIGNYQEDVYPIPVISVIGICDVEIDFDDLTVTTKLNRDQAMAFDWSPFKALRFEVYGVDDYLCDYGNDNNIETLTDRLADSSEKEFFVTFSLPVDTNGEDMLRFVRKLQRSGFYY